MQLKVFEVREDPKEYWNHNKYIVMETHIVYGETLEDCFKKAYPYERSLRYCNGWWIKFESKEIYEQYLEWKKTGVDILMYYGNGTVD